MTTNKTALYLISGGDGGSTFGFSETWSSDKGAGGFNGDYRDLCAVTKKEATYIAGYDGIRQCCDIYRVGMDGKGLELVKQTDLKKSYNTIRPLQVGGNSRLMAYDKESGRIDFYDITEELALVPQLSYRQTYGLVTQGFTTVVPYSYRGDMLLLGYNSDNGTAVVYRLTVPAEAPLAITDVWTKGWSPGWTRFAFFRLGGENFFLKSNPPNKNVNIDHMMDDPTQGSHPVGTHLPLPMDLEAVTAFDLGPDPYFMTYRTEDGASGLNRFHGDCLGWTEVATATTVTGGGRLIPFSLKNKNLVMIY